WCVRTSPSRASPTRKPCRGPPKSRTIGSRSLASSRKRSDPVGELCDLNGHELAGLLRNGEAGATEIVESALRRIDALDDELHAFLLVTGDLARQRAEQVDHQVQAGQELGPVAGIPLALKDVLCTKGIRTTAGSKIL